MPNNDTTKWIVLFLIVIGSVAAYAGASNTIPFDGGNSTVDNATPVDTPIKPASVDGENKVVAPPANQTPIIVNNNYVNVNNNIQVPASIQPSIIPTEKSSDDDLQKATIVKTKTVSAPKVVQQKTVTIKTTDLYTGQVVKLSDSTEVKKGLEVTEINTGKKGCEYIIIKNNNDFDMGMGGYTVYIDETETGVRLPNFEIAAGKSVKLFTVNGKPDTFDKDGDLVKFHFRLAKELYPDDTPVTVYLIEPNFNEAISEITSKA